MTDETAKLVLEILKRMQSEFGLMREDMRDMRAEMTSMNQHMAAFRIGRRLDLSDG